MGEDRRRLQQMSYEMPFKKLIWKFSQLLMKFFFAGKPYSWNYRETLCPNFATELTHEITRENTRKTCFFTHNQLEKFWKTWVIQITSKSKQKEQKSIWFGPHMVEHTHITFEYVKSHKWNKHSLNKRLVCCVWVSNVE